MLQDISPKTQNGIVLNFTPCYPASDNIEDLQACDIADQYINQWYIQPLMEGKYPEVIELLSDDEKPEMSPGDLEIMQHPLDFLGVNFYTRLLYSAPIGSDDLYTELPHREPKTDIGWEVYPQALLDILVSLNQRYRLPPVYITENGAAIADEIENGEVQALIYKIGGEAFEAKKMK